MGVSLQHSLMESQKSRMSREKLWSGEMDLSYLFSKIFCLLSDFSFFFFFSFLVPEGWKIDISIATRGKRKLRSCSFVAQLAWFMRGGMRYS